MWTTVIKEWAHYQSPVFPKSHKFQQTGRSGECSIITRDKNHESQPEAKEETDTLDTASDLLNKAPYVLWNLKCL